MGPTELSVLITGESGTGRGLRPLLHNLSHRAQKPFIPVDCAAILETSWSPSSSARKGAFTGAQSRRGDSWKGGQWSTFFLDEIGELGPIQVKLLRLLRREYRRVGGTDIQTADLHCCRDQPQS